LSRFIFNATSLAISGRVTKPFEQDVQTGTGCVLPVVGGRVSAAFGPYTLKEPETGALVLAFDSAETSVQSEPDAYGVVTTVIKASVRGLNVEDVLMAKEIVLELVLTSADKPHRTTFDASGSRFTDLTISGKPFPVEVNSKLSAEASDYQEFRRTHELPEVDGRTFYTLAENPDLRNDEDGFGLLYVPGFGRIYFAEWIAAPFIQRLNMLRLELGSPVTGRLAVGGGSGNGSFYP
jgi:hypothetical protein